MRGAGRTTGERGSRLRRGLITLQVALSLVLMACAGLLGRSLQQLESQDFGFRTDSRFVAYLAPSLSTIPAEELASVYARTQAALLQVPGVRNAAFSLYSPMSGDNWSGLITVDGHDPAEHLSASWNRVSPRYFDTIGTPLVRGRAFDERDGAAAPPVAIVSESFARTFFGDRDPIGRRIGFTDSRRTGARDTEIVGIVGDGEVPGRQEGALSDVLSAVPAAGLARRRAAGRVAQLDRSHYPQAIEIHTAASAPGLEGAIRRALADVDRRITVRGLLSMDDQLAGAFSLERLIARADRGLRPGRAAARLPRTLRRDRLRCVVADAGNWRAHGRRRLARARAAHRPAGRDLAGGGRHRDRAASGVRGRAAARIAAVRRQRPRRARPGRRHRRAGGVGAPRRADSRAPRRDDGSVKALRVDCNR